MAKYPNASVLSVRLPEDLMKTLNVISAADGVTRTDTVKAMLEEGIRRRPAIKPAGKKTENVFG